MALKVFFALLVIACIPAIGHADPPKERQLTQEEEKLDAEAKRLNERGVKLYEQGKLVEAANHLRRALGIANRLYGPDRYPSGHINVAACLTNLGLITQEIGELEQALEFQEKALAIMRKLFPASKYASGHEALASSLNNLGLLLAGMGMLDQALSHHREALQMRQKLYPVSKYPDGHSSIAVSLNNVGDVLRRMGRYQRAVPYFEQALAIREKALSASKKSDGNPDLVTGLNNLAIALMCVLRHDDALLHLKRSLAINRKLYPADTLPGGHPDLALSLQNLGLWHMEVGRPAEALPYFTEALTIHRRLYPEHKYPLGHPDLALGLVRMGSALDAMGKRKTALEYFEEALTLEHKLLSREMQSAPEAQLIKLIAEHRSWLHRYLSAAFATDGSELQSFERLAAVQGRTFNVLRRRHQAALIARKNSPDLQRDWNELTNVRRELSRRLSVPLDAAGVGDREINELTKRQEILEREIARAVPEVARRIGERLQLRHVIDSLPFDAVLLNFVRFDRRERETRFAARYGVFVVAPGQPIARIDLGKEKPINDAIIRWREDIDLARPSAAPATLKTLIWDKIAPFIPSRVKTILICPDGNIARLPFAALPGKQPGSVLLEDYAIAVVPNPRWLVRQSAFRAEVDGAEALVVGDVDYGAASPPRFEPLPGSNREIASLMAMPGWNCVTLTRSAATIAAVRQRLPQVQVAHFVTHGYHDAEALATERKRQLDARASFDLFAPALGGRNSLAYVGLALAGSNDPNSNGILTGLDIVDLPLERLTLATLSACETGLGDWTPGEGIRGLQHAFHLAGCRNVVASLWKVNDAATAALMAKFYHELWVKKQPPLEALRSAQLTVYYHPERIPALAGERGKPDFTKTVELKVGDSSAKPQAVKRAPTKLWAAFVLSGLGK